MSKLRLGIVMLLLLALSGTKFAGVQKFSVAMAAPCPPPTVEGSTGPNC